MRFSSVSLLVILSSSLLVANGFVVIGPNKRCRRISITPTNTRTYTRLGTPARSTIAGTNWCTGSRAADRLPFSLNEATNDEDELKSSGEKDSMSTDEYDDWYADFDPSMYGDYNRDSEIGSPTSNTGHDYSRDTSVDQSNVDLNEVNRLLSTRVNMRESGRFHEADAIRDTLLAEHGVLVYDRDRSWRTGASAQGSGSKWIKDKNRGGRGNPRDFGPNGHDYRPATDAGPNVSSFSEQEIHQLLAERLNCKLNRRYKEADAIQSELNEAGVYVNDGSRHWRADGNPFEGYSPRSYEQASFSLHTEHVSEIEKLVAQRAKAKAERLFRRADEIRDALREQYGVSVDDRTQQWSVGEAYNGEKRNERSFSSFSMSPYSERPDDFDEVQRLVELRDTARANRDFDTADRIRDDLLHRNVIVNDRSREWSIGGIVGKDEPKPRQYSMTPGSVEPEDYDEIQGLVGLRNKARAERNFDKADQIREELFQRNVVINDRIRQWQYSVSSKKRKGFESPFTRRGGGKISNEDSETIISLLKERDECKRDRHFQSADRIRDRLKEEFQVGIDDGNREWHLITAGYIISADSAPVADDVRQLVQQKIDERAQAKLNKEYDSADEIRDKLAMDFNVSIDDRNKEWRIPNNLDERGVDQDGVDKEGSGTFSLEVGQDDERSEYERLSALTVPELKEMLRNTGLPVSGRKAELIDRLCA